MTLPTDNTRLLDGFARKLRDLKYREVHIYYSPIDYYIIRPDEIVNVEVKEYSQGSQQVLHIENKNWDLDLPTQLIGTVVWHKKSDDPREHPLTKALNNINYKEITVSLNNQQTLVINGDFISNVEESGRNVKVYMRNGNFYNIDLRYVVSVTSKRRTGEISKKYDQAIILIDKKNYEAGKDILIELIEMNGGDYEIFHRLGYTYLKLNQPDKALEALDQSIELNPYGSRTWLLRSKALQDLGRMEDAVAYLKTATIKFPKDFSLHVEFSSALADLKRYDEAVDAQRVVLELDPMNYKEWNYMEQLAKMSGDLDGSISALRKVLELAPKDSEERRTALRRLGCRYCHKGDITTASDIMKDLVEHYPNDSKAWNLLSCISRRKDDYELAEKAARKALEINPEDSSNWASLGYTIQQKNLKEAEKSCRKAVDIDPKNSYAWSSLAKMHFMKNEIKSAVAASDKAEELDPASGTNMYNIAEGYATVKDTKKVLKYLRKALELDPTQVGMLKDEKEFNFIRTNEEFIKLQEEFS